MQLDFMENWEMARKRLEAFWQREIIDRPCMYLIVPPQDHDLLAPSNDLLEKYWTDVDFVLENNIDFIKRTYRLGEAIPQYSPNLGPGIITSFLGCPVELNRDTTWQEPILDNWSKTDHIKFDPENKWYKLAIEFTKKAVELGKGKFMVGFIDLGGAGDLLANLRGSQKLLMDLYDKPEEIEKWESFLCDFWIQIYEDLRNIIQPTFEGTTCWASIWSPGKTYAIQCDLCCMLSEEMFNKYFLPSLEKQAKFLDDALYHLDGPGAVRHLDALLEVPEIKCIQWVPGDGAPDTVHWLDMLKKIQAKGKCIQIGCKTVKDAETLLTELDPRGLFFWKSCASPEEAQHLLKFSEKAALRKAV